MTRLVPLLLLITSWCVAQPLNGAYVACKNLDLEIGQDYGAVSIVAVTFSTYGTFSDGIVWVKNSSNQAVVDYLFVLEFLGPSREHLINVPVFRNLASGGRWVGEEWLQAQGTPEGRMVPAGSSERLVFLTPLISVECPTSARIRAYHVQFSTEEVNGGFETLAPDPVLIRVSNLPIDSISAGGYAPAVIQVDVNAEGIIARVVTKEGLSEGAVEHIRKTWRFSRSPDRPIRRLTIVLLPVADASRDADVPTSNLPVSSGIVETVKLVREGEYYRGVLPAKGTATGLLNNNN